MTDQLPLEVDAPAERRAPDCSAARSLRDALRNHFLAPGETLPGGVFLTEVEAPIDGAVRRADAVYLGFTRTPGWCIDVCEIKVSRADLQREIAQPTKTDAWYPHCTRFWIVAPGSDVAPPESLPEGWGLMVPGKRGRRFRVLREPAVREPVVTLPLLITLAKKMDLQRSEQVSGVSRRLRGEMEDALREQRERHEAQDNYLTPDDRRRLELLGRLEKATGFELANWSGRGYGTDVERATPEEWGRAIRLAMRVVQGSLDPRAFVDAGRQIGILEQAVSEVRTKLRGAERAYEELTKLQREERCSDPAA